MGTKPRRNAIYDSVINRMVREALEAKEAGFNQRHANDSDEELLAYLRRCAIQLRHTPWPREIAGGKLLLERFGTWENAVQQANLLPMSTKDRTQDFKRYQQEIRTQKKIYREKKQAKKQRAAQREAERQQRRAAGLRAVPASETDSVSDTENRTGGMTNT